MRRSDNPTANVMITSAMLPQHPKMSIQKYIYAGAPASVVDGYPRQAHTVAK